ncbi:GntR family transcriptional regulator [Paraburkholderia sp. BCC1884]|uniref:GntR family transcriptional regulator n=1 Tax=Paraburkholderia sp. BCC1884 TaxID=2562668 RepID=UPI001182C85B|nr:GntR family transcriptional regulator [Paraburkholderia sp. BCC1884]
MSASQEVPSVISGNTKHAVVARSLMHDIVSGKYPIGAQLPSEPELALSLAVSRQTVRAALRHLRTLGLITGGQGVRSLVCAAAPFHRFGYTFDSLQHLLQYAANTKVHVISREEIRLNPAQSEWLGRKEGEVWWQVQTIRREPETDDPIASSTILLPYVYGHVLDELDASRETIFSLIERKMGESVTEILQNIQIAKVDAVHAAALSIAVGEAVMCIERRYFGRNGNLIEVSRTLHPSDKFEYSMRVRVQET